MTNCEHWIDYTGTTAYTYFIDGTQATVQLPGHNAQAVQQIDKSSESTTQTTRPDGGTVNQPANPLGQSSSQSGAGVLGANFGYDTAGTGNMTSLITFQNPNTPVFGAVTGTGSAMTSWVYDQATGQLASKTFADGASDTSKYNAAGQLTNTSTPTMSGASFQYNAAGEQVSSSLYGAIPTISTIASQDELGRPIVVSDTSNGKSFTETTGYTAQEQIASQSFGSAGRSSVGYEYGQGDAPPSALDKLTLSDQVAGNPAQQQTLYSYDSITRRLQSIKVNGQELDFTYLANSNQVYTMSVGNLKVLWVPDSSDASRISLIDAQNAPSSTGLFLDYSVPSQFNQQDQRTGEWIVNGSLNARYIYTYDPAHRDALTSVSVNGTQTYTYGFDGVGNFTSNTGVTTTLGTPNSVNEYSNLQYDGSGNLTGDGAYAYSYDAKGNLVKVQPASPTTGSTQEQYGYDSQGRRTWRDVYTRSGSSWALSYSRHYVWDANQLMAVLDQNNQLLQQYTYGPMGLAAVTDYSANPTSPKTYIAVLDAHGNTGQLIDPGDASTGIPATVAASYYYDPYGKLLSSSGPAAGLCIILSKGYIVSPETPWLGLAPNPTGDGPPRIFNFDLDLFMQRDSAGEMQGGLNLEQGFGGDPINNVDPSGLAPENSADLGIAHNVALPPVAAEQLTIGELKVLGQKRQVEYLETSYPNVFRNVETGKYYQATYQPFNENALEVKLAEVPPPGFATAAAIYGANQQMQQLTDALNQAGSEMRSVVETAADLTPIALVAAGHDLIAGKSFYDPNVDLTVSQRLAAGSQLIAPLILGTVLKL